MSNETKATGLELLRKPFPPNQISKLPKPYKKESPKGKCPECGGYHGLPAVHLDYVGHAALTDRLLDADPAWVWEPVAVTERGLPMFDDHGGLWIRLTICGVSRLGYGNAENKGYMDVGAREKEVIGDALRNAAMRFGAALDLWHKGDLHVDEAEDEKPKRPANAKPLASAEQVGELKRLLSIVKLPEGTAKEWLAKADAAAWEDMPAATIAKCITYLTHRMPAEADSQSVKPTPRPMDAAPVTRQEVKKDLGDMVEAGAMSEVEKLTVKLNEAMEARNFTPNAKSRARAAICRKYKVTGPGKLTVEQLSAAIAKIVAGEADVYMNDQVAA